MTSREAAGVIKFEKACVLRQDTPECHRNCKKCDLLLPTEDVLTAYDIAIKALEQETCDDAIRRQAVLEALRTMYDTHIIETEDGDEYIDYNDTVYEIEKLPPVTPQPKEMM